MSRMSISAGSNPDADDSDRASDEVVRRRRVPLEPLLEAVPSQLVDAEGCEQLAEHAVRREITVLELVVQRHDLLLDEGADRVAQHLVFVGPVEHGSPFGPRPGGVAT